MIGRHDRISTVLGRDESLVDVFVSLSPAFERLRNKGMRKVMARLVTVEQAANMAGIDADTLVSAINAHMAGETATAAESGGSGGPEAGSAAGGAACTPGQSDSGTTIPDSSAQVPDESARIPDASARLPEEPAGIPEALARIPQELRIEIDVREELRAGNEPFSQIMAARRDVPPGGAFAVRAIFDPVPLYAVMRRHGLAHHTEQLGDEDWRVWFYRADGEPGSADAEWSAPAGLDAARTQRSASAPGAVYSSSGTGTGSEPAIAVGTGTEAENGTGAGTENGGGAEADTGVMILDVRGLEPPEPMMQTLAALETLPVGGTLVQLNVRVPQFLLPLLEERGFAYEIREQSSELVRVFIRHRAA